MYIRLKINLCFLIGQFSSLREIKFTQNRPFNCFHITLMNQRLNFTNEFTKSKYKFTSSPNNDKVMPTSHPLVFCSKLPQHWRSNKSLPSLFQVIFCQNNNGLLPVDDGHRVWLSASNQSMNNAILRNNESKLINGEARFNDLRFISRSGRGKYFDLYIHIEASPNIVAVYSNAIKVTVDGPREPRNKHKNLYLSKDSLKVPQFIRPTDSESGLCYPRSPDIDDHSNIWNISKIETNFSDINTFENKFNCHFSPTMLSNFQHCWPLNLPLQKPDNLSFLQLMIMASTFRMGFPLTDINNHLSHQNYPIKETKPVNKNKIWRPF
uniref:Transcriptional regulatory protein Runt-1 n=1 Tax=Dugesia japonica TaxID=6161 RepID=A0A1L7H9V6_DUGJA|nr:transcriptional regulatory protein Runt-1 [Dugesia japonica]